MERRMPLLPSKARLLRWLVEGFGGLVVTDFRQAWPQV